MLSVAEVVVEDAVRKFMDAGAVLPEAPPPRWGLRRCRALRLPGDEDADPTGA
jgi:hypothetical protein